MWFIGIVVFAVRLIWATREVAKLRREGEPANGWLDLEQIATVEVTSEDVGSPIESALGSANGPGWRASQPGEQQIRIIFDEPVSIRRMRLCFHEPASERTQEFTLRWAPASGGRANEIVRQQWNFSPAGATTEIEEYMVHLDAVSVLELAIQPGRTEGYGCTEGSGSVQKNSRTCKRCHSTNVLPV